MNARAEAIYDELLLLRCRRGERRRGGSWSRRWERPVFYYIRRLVPREADAWDVLQQTWLAAFKGLGQLARRSSLRFGCTGLRETWRPRIAGG